jgi:prevent-host-death family protein
MNAIVAVTATQLRNAIGSVLDQAARAPLKLTSHGRTRVYLVPAETYERLIALEEAELVRRAQSARKQGMIGPAASLSLIQGLLDAPAKPVSQRRKIAAPHPPKAAKATSRKASPVEY